MIKEEGLVSGRIFGDQFYRNDNNVDLFEVKRKK